jgi:hypothetical protein
MSFIKSASVYLNDINEYIHKKEKQYSSLNEYLNAIRKDESEWNGVLENIIMKYHKFRLSKHRYDKENDAKARNAKMFKGFVITILIIISFMFILNLGGKLSKRKETEQTVADIVSIILLYLIGYLIILFIGVLFITIQTHLINDVEGDKKRFTEIENIFSSFHNVVAVALFYHNKKNMYEPSTSPDRSTIKFYYNIFKRKSISFSNIQSNNLIVDYELDDPIFNNKKIIVATGQVGNKKITFGTVFFDEIDASIKKMRAQSYDKLRRLIRWIEPTTAMKDIQLYGESLQKLVERPISLEDELSSNAMLQVILNEIVPLFNLNKEFSTITGWKPKDMTELDNNLAIKQSVSSNVECMLNCSIDNSCVVASFDNPSKQCSMYKKSLEDGQTMIKSTDNTLFIKDNKIDHVFVEGNDKLSGNHKEATWELEGTTGNCENDCLAGDDCVKFIQDIEGGKCTKTMSKAQIPLDIINPSCSGNECYSYKQSYSNIASQTSIKNLFESVSNVLEDKVLGIMEKYKYQFSLQDFESEIKEALNKQYGTEFMITVGDDVSKVIENIQQKADDKRTQNKEKTNIIKALRQEPSKYISDAEFVEKFDKMTYSNFTDIYMEVEILSHGVEFLNKMTQDAIADNNSASNNIFLKQERELERYRLFIGFGSTIILLAYARIMIPVIFGMKSSFTNNTENSQDNTFFDKYRKGSKMVKKYVNDLAVDYYFKLFVPIIFIVLAIVIMVAWMKKQEALNTYNRDVLEKNGSSLVNYANELKDLVGKIEINTRKQGKNFSLQTLMLDMNVPYEDKIALFNKIVGTIQLLDKCNLLFEGSDIQLQFPWMDVTINLAITTICMILIFVTFYKLNPISLLKDIRKLNMNKKSLLAGEKPDLSIWACEKQTENMDFEMKMIGFIIFLMIMYTFGSKLLESAENYKMGLYNSKYYLEDRCAS